MGTDLSLTEAFQKWAEDLVGYATVLVGVDDANDAVAQAFSEVLASGRWSTVREPRAYLFRATLNAARSQRRSRTRREAREWRTRPHLLHRSELLGDPQVVEAINRLSLQQRAVIYLTYWEDLTPETVGRVLQVSQGTVRRQLARARSRLREVLDEN